MLADPGLRAWLRRLGLGLCASALSGMPAWAQSGARPICVVFPDLGDPFRKFFIEIISGVEEQARSRVQVWPVGASQDPGELAGKLKIGGTRVVIALGRQGIKAASQIDPSISLVVSGVSSVPDSERQIGICLSPDPALLFSNLKNLVPGTKRVIVVYNPQQSDWLLKVAREAARGAALELTALEARDLASAARLYESAFATSDGRRDALWLPNDQITVNEETILPIVLREAWNRSVPVFSSSVSHVKRGALFALYPNNIELGRNLGGIATSILSGEPPARGVAPLRDVHSALNLRTASHIGLTITQRVQRSFNSLYPEP